METETDLQLAITDPGATTPRQPNEHLTDWTARAVLAATAPSTCVGCFRPVRKGVRSDHAAGCPTGQNGTPDYS